MVGPFMQQVSLLHSNKTETSAITFAFYQTEKLSRANNGREKTVAQKFAFCFSSVVNIDPTA